MNKFKVGSLVKIVSGKGAGERGYISGEAWDAKPSKRAWIVSADWGSYNKLETSLELINIGKQTKPKKVLPMKFVVIWEEDRDPAQLFATLKEAKKHARMLGSKSGVQKDSVKIAELKWIKDVKFGVSMRLV